MLLLSSSSSSSQSCLSAALLAVKYLAKMYCTKTGALRMTAVVWSSSPRARKSACCSANFLKTLVMAKMYSRMRALPSLGLPPASDPRWSCTSADLSSGVTPIWWTAMLQDSRR